MDVLNEKIVDFQTWCPRCKHWTLKSTDEPCNECLHTPVRLGSHKPEKFEEKDN